MEAFSILMLIVVGGVAIAVGFSLSQRKHANEAWRVAAGRRGLLFRQGDLFSQPEIVGSRQGHQLSVEVVTRSGDSSERYTRYRVGYRAPLPAGMRISEKPAGFLASVRRAFTGEDIQIGDPEFDERLQVDGNDALLIRAFLTPRRRHMLHQICDRYPGIEIDEHRLSWDVKDIELNPDRIVGTIDQLIETAYGLSPDPAEPSPEHSWHGEEEPGPSPAEEALPPHHIHVPTVGSDQRQQELHDLLASLHDRNLETPPDAPQPAQASGAEDAQAAEIPPAEPAEDAVRLAIPESDVGPGPRDLQRGEPVAAADEAEPEQLGSSLDGAPTVAAVCATLFNPSVTSYELPQVFADSYRGCPVRWSGTLVSAARYPFDRIFGSESGCRAVFSVHRIERAFGASDVRAVLQLPDGEERGLRTSVGSAFDFEGRLIDYDRFMQTLFIADGRIVSSPAAGPTIG